MSGPGAFWHWVDNTLLPGLYALDWYNGHPATWRERRFTSDRETFRVGPVRFRQLRIVPGTLCVHYQSIHKQLYIKE